MSGFMSCWGSSSWPCVSWTSTPPTETHLQPTLHSFIFCCTMKIPRCLTCLCLPAMDDFGESSLYTDHGPALSSAYTWGVASLFSLYVRGRMATTVLSTPCILIHWTFLITLCKFCPYLPSANGEWGNMWFEPMPSGHLCINDGVCFPCLCQFLAVSFKYLLP